MIVNVGRHNSPRWARYFSDPETKTPSPENAEPPRLQRIDESRPPSVAMQPEGGAFNLEVEERDPMRGNPLRRLAAAIIEQAVVDAARQRRGCKDGPKGPLRVVEAYHDAEAWLRDTPRRWGFRSGAMAESTDITTFAGACATIGMDPEYARGKIFRALDTITPDDRSTNVH